MFNSPRPNVRHGNNLVANFDDNDPLSSSAYDGLDPWSTAPSSTPAPAVPSVFSNVIADATAPRIYTKTFQVVDPTFSGEVSVNALSRVLATSALPATTVDRIVNLVSSRPRVSKLEFFVALALVALAQSGRDISIEKVAALASQNALPEPTLDLSAIVPTTSAFVPGTDQTDIPRSPAPQYSSDDPWTATFRTSNQANGSAPTSLTGGGLPSEWWRRQDKATVEVIGQQGFLLTRHMVYLVETTVGLLLCLPLSILMRLVSEADPYRGGIPNLSTSDANFVEQRRRGLIRWLNFVINHPIIREDGILSVFLNEPAFEEWRKHTKVSLDEEAMSKRVDGVEEMTIPSDLEDKLHADYIDRFVRDKLNLLIEQWQRICILTERLVKRRESAGADLARMTMTLNALVEGSNVCWRGEDCELCTGVQGGLKTLAGHTCVTSDLADSRSRAMSNNTLEAVKAQRDLYLTMRDLFSRHDRLSGDQVERIKKRIEGSSAKLEVVKAAKKDNWEDEADRIISTIERDQALISTLLARRVFIRHSMWHELRVVLHNRENTLVTQTVQLFAKEESNYAKAIHSNWNLLMEQVDSMPFE
ncbi:hypothetical protein Clacol_005716 [Clathrus columnatus]|uniref:Sorting nexin MVP1 n=1 Tax=Clathrus columnatus TaxID=1419009 RepID=A0AAV5AEC5_9AGAM|nr:hypothetical protein Clacol_005716 [Clathrus columnatus]